MIRYKSGKENIVANALSRRYSLLSTLSSKLMGFEFLKEMYENDGDFGKLFFQCVNGIMVNNFYVFDGFLFRKDKLCIPRVHIENYLLKKHMGVV